MYETDVVRSSKNRAWSLRPEKVDLAVPYTVAEPAAGSALQALLVAE